MIGTWPGPSNTICYKKLAPKAPSRGLYKAAERWNAIRMGVALVTIGWRVSWASR